MLDFIKKTEDYGYNNRPLTEIEKIKIQYGMTIFKNEGIKMVILLFIFLLLDKLVPFLFCMLITGTVRIFAGGLHMSSNIGCFFFSLIVLSLETIILPEIPITVSAYNALIVISTIIICIFAPIASKKKPFKGQKRYTMCKRASIIFSSTWCIVLIIFIKDMQYKSCGSWVVVIQAIQMIILAITNRFNLKESRHV